MKLNEAQATISSEVVMHVLDEGSGLRGFVVADLLIDGRAMGGVRMTPDVTVQEVAALARKMTLKLALAELPIGGAKGGIICDLAPGERRDNVLRAFGRAVGPALRGGIYLGSDMGCNYRDRTLIHGAAGYEVLSRRGAAPGADPWKEFWDGCWLATGHGVAEGAMEFVDMTGLAARTVSIQGFGIVGRGLAQCLSDAGYRIVAVADRAGSIYCAGGLPVRELMAITSPAGDIDRTRLPRGVAIMDRRDGWLDVEVGVLALAAGTHGLNEDNVDRVRCGVVVEGANLASSPRAHAELARRGIPALPDIAVNSGGAMASGLILSGLAPRDTSHEVLTSWVLSAIGARIRRLVKALVARSRRTGDPIPTAAMALAHERASRYRSERMVPLAS